MWRHNFLSYSFKIIISLILEIIYFPIWWYGEGLFKVVVNLFSFLRNQERSLGFFIWLKNVFVPMYGQYDWPGRLISFFIRLVQIIIRGVALFVWLVICLSLLIIWLALPVLLVLFLFFQILK